MIYEVIFLLATSFMYLLFCEISSKLQLVFIHLFVQHVQVATGGADGILNSAMQDKLNALHNAIASLVAEPKSEESEEEHVLENFHSSRTIRKLILDSPTFASTLWNTALKGKCEMWAVGHRLALFYLS